MSSNLHPSQKWSTQAINKVWLHLLFVCVCVWKRLAFYTFIAFIYLSILILQSTKTSSKKKVKASLGTRAVGKGSKRLDDMEYDNELGAEFDDFI